MRTGSLAFFYAEDSPPAKLSLQMRRKAARIILSSSISVCFHGSCEGWDHRDIPVAPHSMRTRS